METHSDMDREIACCMDGVGRRQFHFSSSSMMRCRYIFIPPNDFDGQELFAWPYGGINRVLKKDAAWLKVCFFILFLFFLVSFFRSRQFPSGV